jgi:CheY-like chemotaxis protein
MRVLLVEDDPGHAELIRKNLRRGSSAIEVTHVDDGQKALDYLFQQGLERNEHPLPDVVILDLNIPVLDGYQVLQAMKQDERMRTIPVTILTTTDTPHEIQRCYELGCNLYVFKPVQYERFTETMQRLGMFLVIIKTPAKDSRGDRDLHGSHPVC